MAKKNKQTTTTQNKGFQQYGEINHDYCSLTRDHILDLIRSRNKARRSRNFTTADEILATLNKNNVHLNDSKKLWRADGEIFDIKGYSKMRYTKSSNSKPITAREEEYVKQKLNERSEAKLRRDFNSADDILDELRFLKNIIVDDSALTWRVAEPFKTSYTYGGRRLNNVPEEEISNIERLIRERADAKERKDYAKADKILEDLQIRCGVRVDDTKKTWYFLPKIEDEDYKDAILEKNQRWDKNDTNTRVNTRQRNQRKNVPDWSETYENVPERKSMPEGNGISSDDKEIPEGISISSSEPEIPEGISISSSEPEIPEGISIAGDAIPDGITISDEPATIKLLPSKSELSGFTVPMLKEKLRAAGLPVSGRKSELIDRLLEVQ